MKKTKHKSEISFIVQIQILKGWRFKITNCQKINLGKMIPTKRSPRYQKRLSVQNYNGRDKKVEKKKFSSRN